MTHAKEIIAPIQIGQEIGTLTVETPGQQPLIVPLLAGENVEAKKGLSRAISVLKRKIGGA